MQIVQSPARGIPRSPLRRGALRLIGTYRREVSGRLPGRCRLAPSCSEHAHQAYASRTFLMATASTAWRILRCTFGGRGRRTRRLLAFPGLALLAVVGVAAPAVMMTELVTAAPAGAASECTGTISGQDANQFRTPDQAYKVRENASVFVTGHNSGLPPVGPLHYLVQLRFYLLGDTFDQTVAVGDSTTNSFQRSVNVHKYATRGTGLYLVHVVSYGPAGSSVCATDGFVDVVGSGLSDAEIAGITFGLVGLAAGVGSGLSAANEGKDLTDPDKLAAAAQADAAAEVEDDVAFGAYLLDLDSPFGYCGFLVIPALALAGKAVVSGVFHTVVQHVTRSA